MNPYCGRCVERLFGCTVCDQSKWRHNPGIIEKVNDRIFRPIHVHEKKVKRKSLITGSFLEDKT